MATTKIKATTVGFFAWQSLNGKLFPEKYSIERVGMNPEAKKYFEDRTAREEELDATHWALSLDELAALFPPPKAP